MRLSALVLCLVLVAGAHAGPAASSAKKQAPKPAPKAGAKAGAGGDRPAVPPIPEDLAKIDVTKLAPAISVLPVVGVDQAMSFVGLLPKVNVTWVEAVIPYLSALDPAAVGKLGQAIITPIQKIAPSTLGSLMPALGHVDGKAFAELIPLVATLDVNTVKRIVPAINGFSPEVLGKIMKLATALTPETYNALTNIINVAVPGVNAAADKLNMLPVAISMPPPPAYQPSASKSWSPLSMLG